MRWRDTTARRLATVLVMASAACSGGTVEGPRDAGGGGGGGNGGSGGSDIHVDGGGGGPGICDCIPGVHGDSIFVLSSSAEIWTYNPTSNAFSLVAPASCGGSETPYSMAVDRAGRAWVLYADTHDVFTIDVNHPAGCQDPGFSPDQAGFGLFGMAFSANGPGDPCSELYVHTYDGAGPFGEGPGAGTLGVVDPATLSLSAIGSIDYDGGELAGTADGRLFAFAGVNPVKLIEYDKTTAKPITTLPLVGFSKTGASAFAFYRGDVYFFTDAYPAACDPCLQQNCGAVYAACKADPACAEQIACVLGLGDFTDACGGGLPAELQQCLIGPCQPECFVPDDQKMSQVTRLDYDDSEGQGQVLTVVNGAAPIRVVGAGVSTCVPVVPE